MSSLHQIHGISNYPTHFLNDEYVLIESGTILSCLNIENGEQQFISQLNEFDSISCIASNILQKILVIAIQSKNGTRIEIYRYRNIDNIQLLYTFDEECSNSGYSHIDISKNGEYIICISNIPDLQIELWNIKKREKLSSANIPIDDIKFVSFSPTSHELFMTANNNSIILWRVYYKFDQYFLTQTIHSLKQLRQIITVTFGDKGKEIIYCNNFGELIVFDEQSALNDFNQNIKYRFNNDDNDNLLSPFKLIYTRFYYVAIFSENGIIKFISRDTLQIIYESCLGSNIKHCIFSPNYKQLLIINQQNKLFNCFIDKSFLITNHKDNIIKNNDDIITYKEIYTFHQINPNQGFQIISLQKYDSLLLYTQTLQLLSFNVESTKHETFSINDISTMEIFHYRDEIDLIALGFNDGYIGLCYINNSNISSSPKLKLFFLERLFKYSVKQIQFDINGKLISCISEQESKIWFISLQNNILPQIMGYYKLNNVPKCCCWINDAQRKLKIIISFNNGFVATYNCPKLEKQYDHIDDDDDDPLLLDSFYIDCEVDFSLTKIIRDPNKSSPDRLICLTEDNKLKAFLLDDDATVFPDDTFIFNDHLKCITDIKVQGDLLLTASKDGIILMRYLSDPNHIISSIYAHPASTKSDGILSAQFVNSGSKIISVGYDSSVISWELDDEITFFRELWEIDCPLNKQYLDQLPVVNIDNNDNKLTFQHKLKQEKMNKQKKDFEPILGEIENELKTLRINYNVITDKIENASKLEKLQEKELIVDNKQYESLLNENENEINKIRKEIKYENIGKQLISKRIKEQCWDSMKEKLQIVKGIKTEKQITTFPILSHDKNELQLIKKLQFLRKMNIIEQEWSSKTQDRIKYEFDIKQCVKNKEISYIWDINELTKENKQQKNDNLGNAQNKEEKNKNKSGNKGTNNNKNTKSNKNKKDKDKKNDQFGDENGVKFPISQSLKDLLYHPLKLYTNYSKRIQINLLNLRMRDIKSAFNIEVAKIFKLKQAEVERINEMAFEIKDIQKELILNDEIFIAKLDKEENKNEIFIVNDSEIGVEKVLTEKELKELKKQEIEKLKREKNTNNDITERALYDMMNNTLESKDEVSKLEDKLKKPEFMDSIEESQWTEQQRAQIIQYQEKKDELIKAKEIRRKLLTTRLKSLKNEVSDICKNFDGKLQDLYNTRLSVMKDIYVHQLMLIHSANDIVEYEQYEKKLKNLNLELIQLNKDKKKADLTYNQFNHKLQQSKQRLDNLNGADKYLEKTFKKEMSVCGSDYFDYLYKLFRGKKAIPPKHSGNTIKSGSIGLERRNSYSTNDSNSDILSVKRSLSKMGIRKKSVSKSLKNIDEDNDDNNDDNNDSDKNDDQLLINQLKEESDCDLNEFDEEKEKEKEILDPYFEIIENKSDDILIELRNLTKPIDLSYQIWNKFMELRKLKIVKDGEIERILLQIGSMEIEINALSSNMEIIVESISEIEKTRNLLIEKREKYLLDCELFFNLKQGNCEVFESPVVTDMRQSVILNKKLITNLNNIILNAGNDQIQRLNEIKKFRRGINLLNWKAKILDLEYRYYTLLTTEYQLRRVTKKDQEVIKFGGHDSKQKNEVSSLERKLKFTKNTMNTKIKDKRKQLNKYQNRLENIENSNQDLIQEIKKLENDVISKQEIVSIRGKTSIFDQKKQLIQKKMDSVVTRRKLNDLVKAQSEEIQFLRNELDRLRRRTFPSFNVI